MVMLCGFIHYNSTRESFSVKLMEIFTTYKLDFCLSKRSERKFPQLYLRHVGRKKRTLVFEQCDRIYFLSFVVLTSNMKVIISRQYDVIN